MRDKIVERIARFLDPRDFGRYGSVIELLFKLEAGLPTVPPLTRNQKKIFANWDVTSFDFDALADDQLLDIYELVMRRYAVQR